MLSRSLFFVGLSVICLFPDTNGFISPTRVPGARFAVTKAVSIEDAVHLDVRDPHPQPPPWTSTCASDGGELHYMPFFRWQMDLLTTTLDAKPLAARDELLYRENLEKEARIGSALFETEQFRKVRMTYFDAGTRVQVFNSLWYPKYHLDAPVLGIDLLCFGEQKILAVIDCQPLTPKGTSLTDHSQFLAPFTAVKRRFPSLCGKMSNRFYDENQFFSDAMLFGRFDEHSPIQGEVFQAFTEYVGEYVQLITDLSKRSSGVSPSEVRERQAAYDQYSAERDPAHALFKSYFGEEWADDYMRDFLFELHADG